MEDASQNLPDGGEHETDRVSITLTSEQVNDVVRAAVGVGNMSVLLAGLSDIEETLAREPELLNDPRTSSSVLTSLLMMAAMPSDGAYIGLSELAKKLGIGPGTAHRYATTFVYAGMIERHPTSRKYRLAI